MPSHEATIAVAIQWLLNLLTDFPHCHLHFLLGNHDCLTQFQTALAQLAEAQPRFSWHEHLLQLGPHLFLHGDCTTRKMGPQEFRDYRRFWTTDHGRRHGLPTVAYFLADSLGITRLVHKVIFRKGDTLDRLTYYLDKAQPNWRETVRFCYFGHTHEPFANRQKDGIAFFNTGSTIRGMEFEPASFLI